MHETEKDIVHLNTDTYSNRLLFTIIDSVGLGAVAGAAVPLYMATSKINNPLLGITSFASGLFMSGLAVGAVAGSLKQHIINKTTSDQLKSAFGDSPHKGGHIR